MILQPGKTSHICLRNFTILAKTATQVTTNTADGQDHAPRMEMVQGFFLNGVVVQGRYFPVNLGYETPVHISPDPAFPGLALVQSTKVGTQQALDLAIL
jgi:hypothetical protein